MLLCYFADHQISRLINRFYRDLDQIRIIPKGLGLVEVNPVFLLVTPT